MNGKSLGALITRVEALETTVATLQIQFEETRHRIPDVNYTLIHGNVNVTIPTIQDLVNAIGAKIE